MGRNKQWSDEDKAFVSKHYSYMDIEEISAKIDRTIDSIRQYASANGLTREFTAIAWTREDLDYIKKNYAKKTIGDISDHLGRTKSSVAAKITILRAANGLLPGIDKSQIDKNIVFYSGKQAQYRALMAALDINDSFEYPAIERQTVNNCYPYFQDRVFSTKKVDDATRRCWRRL